MNENLYVHPQGTLRAAAHRVPLCYHRRPMAVNPELLKILVCPLCKAPVNLTDDGNGLKCSQCRRVYPIRDDIPVMLISEAKVED